jgi:dethiobiotin synthetase
VPFDDLVRFCRDTLDGPADFALVEGVGGIMAPIDGRHTVLDWAAVLQIPVLLVAGTYLGTISHTLTALGALAARGVTVAALILSESAESPVPPAETAAAIARFAASLRILHVPRLAGRQAWRRVPLYDALTESGRTSAASTGRR